MVQAESRPGSLRWHPDSSRVFTFVDRTLDRNTGTVDLIYRLDAIDFTERLHLPGAPFDSSSDRSSAIEAALDLLHWTVGISYWKAGCPSQIRFSRRRPDRWQADFLTHLYRKGLAEFAFENQLDPDHFPTFPAGQTSQAAPSDFTLARRTLVPIGGGKDSLVAWERLRARGESPDSVQVGSAPLIRALGETLPGRHWEIARRLDPALQELNDAGALNGHVPVTAINSAIIALAALLLDYDRVAFANERSASEASRLDQQGREVNHQFSKSFEFEAMFDDWVRRYIHCSLRVFSLLRRDRELAICRDFSRLTSWHRDFSSCNRNFHLDGPRGQRWCGQCPKCRFVFLCLAPFMSARDLSTIFSQNLLDQTDQIGGFAELLALDGVKPFECVGEANEARAAVIALADQADWSNRVVVRALKHQIEAQGHALSIPAMEDLCQPGGEHRIPGDLLDAP